jgi:hypothetical protein
LTSFVRPSDGAVRTGPFLNLNYRNFQSGERVLYELVFGWPEIGTIESMPSCNRAIIDGGSVVIQAVRHRIPRGASAAAEAALLEMLHTSHRLSPRRYDRARDEIVKAWRRDQRGLKQAA